MPFFWREIELWVLPLLTWCTSKRHLQLCCLAMCVLVSVETREREGMYLEGTSQVNMLSAMSIHTLIQSPGNSPGVYIVFSCESCF